MMSSLALVFSFLLIRSATTVLTLDFDEEPFWKWNRRRWLALPLGLPMTSFRVVSSVVGPSSTLNKRNSSKIKKREMKIFWSNKLNEIQCNPRDDVVLQFISGTTELERGWNRSVVEKVNDLVATVVFLWYFFVFDFLDIPSKDECAGERIAVRLFCIDSGSRFLKKRKQKQTRRWPYSWRSSSPRTQPSERWNVERTDPWPMFELAERELG